MTFFQRLKYLFAGDPTPEVIPLPTPIVEPANIAEAPSDEPFIRIVGEPSVDTNADGVHLELEWNTAFVNYLREHGYHGASEDLIVNKWLRALYRQQSDRVLGSEFQ